MAKTWPSRKQRLSGSHRNDPYARSDATAARRVLRDAYRALGDLGAAEDPAHWRLRWVGVVTLLRAVGHVLDKVDGGRSTPLKSSIKEWWETLKANRASNAIFFEFIDKERNSILKEYRLAENLVLPLQEGENLRLSDRPILFLGRLRTQSELIREALHWWETELREIETAAHRRLKVEIANRRASRRETPTPTPQADIVLRVVFSDRDAATIRSLCGTGGSAEITEDISVTAFDQAACSPFDDACSAEIVIPGHVGVSRGSRAIANWLTAICQTGPGSVKLGNSFVDPSAPRLHKTVAGKIARRRMYSQNPANQTPPC